MNYFSTRECSLFPSYALSSKKEKELDDYLSFLDRSGVAELIKNDEITNGSLGGRPPINRYSLFATILFSFTYDSGSLREISDKCEYDLRYMYLMRGETVSFKTVCNFINDTILPKKDEIFTCLTKAILQELDIKLDEVFIDGTKIEADANKYKFVWKPLTWHKRLCDKVRNLLEVIGLNEGVPKDDIFSSNVIIDKMHTFYKMIDPNDKVQQKQFDNLKGYLEKALEYEEKERICGPDRNSYYKTDHDATAMTLKTDYYSGLGSNMHAVYSTQIAVVKGIVIERLTSQNRSDTIDFISIVDKIDSSYGEYPRSICADSAYGSFDNLKKLNDRKIVSYVKSQSWQGNVSGRNPDRYRVNDDNTLTCLNGNIGKIINIPNRHPKRVDSVFFKVEGCADCPFTAYCKRWQNNKDEDFKIFEVDILGSKLKQISEENLLSPKGIEMRINRSIQVEGVYGIIKYDMDYNRFRRTGIDRADLEFTLTLLGYNLRKLFKHFKGELDLTFWEAPKDLRPETFKTPSAKRLTNKINKKKNKSLNQKAKSSYKYNRKRGGKT